MEGPLPPPLDSPTDTQTAAAQYRVRLELLTVRHSGGGTASLSFALYGYLHCDEREVSVVVERGEPILLFGLDYKTILQSNWDGDLRSLKRHGHIDEQGITCRRFGTSAKMRHSLSVLHPRAKARLNHGFAPKSTTNRAGDHQ